MSRNFFPTTILKTKKKLKIYKSIVWEPLHYAHIPTNYWILFKNLILFSVPIPKPIPPPEPFPRPDIVVNCLADGVSVTVEVADPNFHGVMYVKGHSNDPNCRRTVENGEAAEPLDFAVKFDTCGLFHSDVSNIILGFPILNDIFVLFYLKTTVRKIP